MSPAAKAPSPRPSRRPGRPLHQADTQPGNSSTAWRGLDRRLQLRRSDSSIRAGRPSRPGRPSAAAPRTPAMTPSRRASAISCGPDRRAARRQFVDHRNVEVGVVAHRQRARDRRRRHHQLVRAFPMRRRRPSCARQTAAHAEAVLFVDDRQPRLAKSTHPGSARACRRRGCAGRSPPACSRLLGRRLQAAGQPGDADAQRLQPARFQLR